MHLCDTGICHSVWVASGLLVGLKSNQQNRRHPYRVTNTRVANTQQFSADDGHVDDRNMYRREINKYVKQNCAPSCTYLRAQRDFSQYQTCSCFPPFDLKMETDLASETLSNVSCFVEILHCREFYKSNKTYPCIDLDRRFGFQEIEDHQISRQSAYKGSEVVSTTHQPHLPPPHEIPLVLNC